MKLQQIHWFSKRNTPQLKQMYCEVPYYTVQITNPKGDISVCCPSWLPHVAGNINEMSILTYLQSNTHSFVLDSVTGGDFQLCDHNTCPEIQTILVGESSTKKIHPLPYNNRYHKRIDLYLNYDPTCNLQCPSCRNELIVHNGRYPKHIMDTHVATMGSITELLDAGYRVNVMMTGSGDPFVSELFLDILREYHTDSDKLYFSLMTNGVRMSSNMLDLVNVKDRCHGFNISIDAATKDTYDLVRRGGDFDQLHTNLMELNSKIKNGHFRQPNIYFQTNFIISSMNYKEIPLFAQNMLNNYDQLNHVWFNLITDWGHFPDGKFMEYAIWQPQHPDHQDFLNVMKHPILKHPKVILGNASRFAA